MIEPDITKMPYATWLEKNLLELIKLPVRSITICATTNNGDVYREYYNTSMADKLITAGIIQQDAMLDSMAANGIIEYVDEEVESDGEAEE